MGHPVFTWMPIQQRNIPHSTDRQSVDLGEPLSDLQITSARNVFDHMGIHGGRSRSMTRAWLDVRITLERFTDRDLFRRLTNMINHLERGGTVAFAADSEKIYGSHLSQKLGIGHHHVNVNLGNYYKAWHSDAPDTLAAGDGFVVEDGLPRAARDQTRVSTIIIPGVDVGETDVRYNLDVRRRIMNDYAAGVHVRHEDFFPKLVLPQQAVGSPLLTHDHRISYTLDLPLQYIFPRRVFTASNQPGGVSPENEAMSAGLADKPDYNNLPNGG